MPSPATAAASRDHAHRLSLALAQAICDIPAVGWYEATESAAQDHEVSLPEVQRRIADATAALNQKPAP